MGFEVSFVRLAFFGTFEWLLRLLELVWPLMFPAATEGDFSVPTVVVADVQVCLCWDEISGPGEHFLWYAEVRLLA